MKAYGKYFEVGKGAYGKVIKAYNKKTKVDCAIKIIKLLSKSEDDISKITNEVAIMQKFDHPNIIKYYDHFIENNNLYIVMEWADMNLKQLLGNKKSFSEDEVVNFYLQIASGLSYVHKSRIIHRDIKPENILVINGQYKIADFGVSKQLNSVQQYAQTAIGTPLYIAPEIWRFEPYDYKVDIWSLGCLLYEICNGDPPFVGLDFSEIISKVENHEIHRINPKYSPKLENHIREMLSLEPHFRPTIEDIPKFFSERNIDFPDDFIDDDDFVVNTEPKNNEFDSFTIDFTEQDL